MDAFSVELVSRNRLVDAFCIVAMSDNRLVDKIGVALLPSICVSFGVQSVGLVQNLSSPGAIFRP